MIGSAQQQQQQHPHHLPMMQQQQQLPPHPLNRHHPHPHLHQGHHPHHPHQQGHHPVHGTAISGLGGGVTTYYRTISADNKPTTVIIGPNGEPIKLPDSLESLPKSDHFPAQRHRWNTNEEIASMLIAFERHSEWLSKEVRIRPKSGSMLLYSRKKVRYRRDGYCWKKRKDGKTTREDHMKLKVQGIECIYGCYVHSAILPTFHRRCYWLLQNPDVVLVHYLNVPYPDDNKMLIASSVNLWAEKKEWTKEELICQLKPMFFSEEEPDLNNELEISTAETVETIVTQLMEKQRAARAAALNKQLECGCPETNATNGDKTQCCIHASLVTAIPGVPGAKKGVQKSEAHTTTGGGGGRSRSSKQSQRMMQRLMQQDNNNQEHGRMRPGPAAAAYDLSAKSSKQVSSTTGGAGHLGSHLPPDHHHPHHLRGRPSHHQLQQQHLQLPPVPPSHHHQNSQAAAAATAAAAHQQHLAAAAAAAQQHSPPYAHHPAAALHHSQPMHHQHQMHQHLTPPAHHGQHQHHYSHHGPHYQPLVLSLSQPNQAASHPHQQQGPNNNSLLILNNQNGPQPEHNNSIFRLTPPDGVPAHQNGSGSNRSDTMDSSASSNSPLESGSGASGASVAGLGSPVSSAVRSLTSLSDFSSLDMTVNGGNNFDAYSGLQPITDSLLSTSAGLASASQEDRPATENNSGDKQEKPSASGEANNNKNNTGPLMDFKTAFSVLDDKSGNLSFLHDSFDNVNNEEVHRSPSHRTAAAAAYHQAAVAAAAAAAANVAGGPHPMEYGGPSQPPAVAHAANPFDLDSFDMLAAASGAFPEMDGSGNYRNPEAGGHVEPGMLGSNAAAAAATAGTGSPMLGSGGSTTAGHKKDRSGGQHFHPPPHVTDYSPEWAWTEGGTKLLVIVSNAEESKTNTETYEVLFDGNPVAAEEISPGVLRCVCPEHDVGKVNLQVRSTRTAHPVSAATAAEVTDKEPIVDDLLDVLSSVFEDESDKSPTVSRSKSEPVTFEFRDRPNTQQPAADNCNSYMCGMSNCRRDLKFKLTERLEALLCEHQGTTAGDPWENYVFRLCHDIQCELKLKGKSLQRSGSLRRPSLVVTDTLLSCDNSANPHHNQLPTASKNEPTILHYAATLGLKRLCDCLMDIGASLVGKSSSASDRYGFCRAKSASSLGTGLTREPSPNARQNKILQLLRKETNLLAQDEHGFTPLMCACFCGHEETASTLYERNPTSSKIKNFFGQTCLDIASSDSLRDLLNNKPMSNTSENSESSPFVVPCSPADVSSGPKWRTKSLDGRSSVSPFRVVPVRAIKASTPSGLQTTQEKRLSKRSSLDFGPNSGKAGPHLPPPPQPPPSSEEKKLLTWRSSSLPLHNNKVIKIQAESCDVHPGSPIIDVEGMSDENEEEVMEDGQRSSEDHEETSEDQKVLSLAEQFIAAMPARIKNENQSNEGSSANCEGQRAPPATRAPSTVGTGSPLPWGAGDSESDLGIESMDGTGFGTGSEFGIGTGSELDWDFDFNFDFRDCSYREGSAAYTPSSALSMSPPSSSCLGVGITGGLGGAHSPTHSTSYTLESPSPCTPFSVDTSTSPQGTTQDLQEFLQASMICERDMSNLTLSDREQRELYEAAQIIQKAYRSYKGRKGFRGKSSQAGRSGPGCAGPSQSPVTQEREAKAAVVIQNYYRRYKQYLYWKQMAKAATVIQNKYRTYCEHKRFKKSQEAAMCIQNYYRTYKEHQGMKSSSRSSRESTPSTSGIKRTYSQRRQHQAAKKIQQFMKKTHLKPSHLAYSWRVAQERPGCFTCRKREASPSSGQLLGGGQLPPKLSAAATASTTPSVAATTTATCSTHHEPCHCPSGSTNSQFQHGSASNGYPNFYHNWNNNVPTPAVTPGGISTKHPSNGGGSDRKQH